MSSIPQTTENGNSVSDFVYDKHMNGYYSRDNVIKLSGHENTQEKEGKCTLSKLSDIRKRN